MTEIVVALDEDGRRAARTYGAAADHYCGASLGFWDRFGAATVSRLRIAPGQSVLDLCCGAGASAIPAARAVGRAGRVCGCRRRRTASDMAAFVAEMWRLVRPGGRLALTTWGPELFEPANSVFWESVREVEPSRFKAFNPWDEITTPQALNGLLKRSGVSQATVQAVPGEHVLDQSDDFWDVVLGSGYRATVDALEPQQCETVRGAALLE